MATCRPPGTRLIWRLKAVDFSRAGVRYTRNGNFQQSSDGRLVTAQGDPLLGDQGPILLPAGEISISADGTLSVAGALAGKLRIVDLPGTEVTPVGNSYMAATDKVRPASDTVVRQGALESANLDATAGIANLITVLNRDFNRIADPGTGAGIGATEG
jgi:flagellar basal-body rod protein FlgF